MNRLLARAIEVLSSKTGLFAYIFRYSNEIVAEKNAVIHPGTNSSNKTHKLRPLSNDKTHVQRLYHMSHHEISRGTYVWQPLVQFPLYRSPSLVTATDRRQLSSHDGIIYPECSRALPSASLCSSRLVYKYNRS